MEKVEKEKKEIDNVQIAIGIFLTIVSPLLLYFDKITANQWLISMAFVLVLITELNGKELLNTFLLSK